MWPLFGKSSSRGISGQTVQFANVCIDLSHYLPMSNHQEPVCSTSFYLNEGMSEEISYGQFTHDKPSTVLVFPRWKISKP